MPILTGEGRLLFISYLSSVGSMCDIRAYCFLFAHSATFTRSKCSYDGLIVALLLANTAPSVPNPGAGTDSCSP